MSTEEILALYRQYGIAGGERQLAQADTGTVQAAGAPQNAPRGPKADTAVVWKLRPDNTLEPVQVSVGITDHAFTQIIATLKGELRENDALVIRSVLPKNQAPGTLRR